MARRPTSPAALGSARRAALGALRRTRTAAVAVVGPRWHIRICTPGSPIPGGGRGRGQLLAWTPGDPLDGLPPITGDAPVIIETPDVASLTAFARHALTRAAVRHVQVRVDAWDPPVVGWIGTAPLPPGVLRWEVRLPESRGPAELRVVLRRPRPLRAILGSVLGVLTPPATSPAPVSQAVTAPGPAPEWLAIADDRGARVPGLGWDAERRAARTGQGHPGPRLPVADLEVVADGTSAAGQGPVPLDVLTVDGPLVVTHDRRTLLVDPRGVAPARWDGAVQGGAVVQVRVQDGRAVWRSETDASRAWLPVTAPFATQTLAWLRGHGHATLRLDDEVPAPDAAAFVARLCLTGVVLAAGALPGSVRALLAPELEAIVSAPLPDPADRMAWEMRSIGQRRAVVRGHAPHLAASALGVAPPSVSVLVMTRRPETLDSLRAMLARQTYPALEVLVGIHTETAGPLRWDGARDVPMESIAIPVAASLGEGLGRLMARARGTLVAKMDDDDIYGPEHIWDLVVARELSGATVVGKAAEHIALDALGITVRRGGLASDAYERTVAGGTILGARGDLETLGGWRPVRAAVDRALLDRVLEGGGLVYRTWSPGFIYRRHGTDHTWDAEDEHFLRDATERWTGFPDHPAFGAHLAPPMASPIADTDHAQLPGATA